VLAVAVSLRLTLALHTAMNFTALKIYENLWKFIVQMGRMQKDFVPVHFLCKIPNLVWNYHAWKFSIEN
jgi:hypothetical protein